MMWWEKPTEEASSQEYLKNGSSFLRASDCANLRFYRLQLNRFLGSNVQRPEMIYIICCIILKTAVLFYEQGLKSCHETAGIKRIYIISTYFCRYLQTTVPELSDVK